MSIEQWEKSCPEIAPDPTGAPKESGDLVWAMEVSVSNQSSFDAMVEKYREDQEPEDHRERLGLLYRTPIKDGKCSYYARSVQ